MNAVCKLVVVLWCVVGARFESVDAQAANNTAIASSLATNTSDATVVIPFIPNPPSASGNVAAATSVGTVKPVDYAAAPTTVDTAYTCNGDEVARLAKLSENNPYLHLQCTSLAGISSYVFPFNGELGYARMVAMSLIQDCTYYFRAVLLIQLQECAVANVYVRTTAETILQLAATSGDTPTEAQVNAAKDVRKRYNLALRDGDGSASYAATEGASALSWTIEGHSIDTIASAKTDGQLLMSKDMFIVGTYYAPSSSSSSAQEDSAEVFPPSTVPGAENDTWGPGVRTNNTSGSSCSSVSSWIVALTVVWMHFVGAQQ
ncbi:unnamed protein product [Hyaloperonospora brassicae]|uniref:Uncharacterized protein n=1 Tax=Hyaloperonospora brassicae TaxID=162125 RepID=A0AAV0UIW7_HYABA|nr:unnamed protein product [Hyaloperonospora brassicae]